ncbi:MAG: hypothetical protein AAFY29_11830 [Pseudomonadota bacterium]
MPSSPKYRPLVVTVFFCVVGLLVSVFLNGVNYLLGEGFYAAHFEATLILCVVAVLSGVVYCEVRARVANRLKASIMFGVASSRLFFVVAELSTLLHEGTLKPFPVELYIALTGMLTAILAFLFMRLALHDT